MAVSTKVTHSGLWLLLAALGFAGAQTAACSPPFHSCVETRTCPVPPTEAGAAGEESGGGGAGRAAGGASGSGRGEGVAMLARSLSPVELLTRGHQVKPVKPGWLVPMPTRAARPARVARPARARHSAPPARRPRNVRAVTAATVCVVIWRAPVRVPSAAPPVSAARPKTTQRVQWSAAARERMSA